MENTLNENKLQVTEDEKLLSLLAHLSIFLGGIILPIILWATQKDKSKFVCFNSLQAIFYHIVYGIIIVLFVFVMIFFLILSGIGFNSSEHYGRHGDTPAAFVAMLIIFMLGLFAVVFGGIAYAVYLAVKSYQGDLVKIPVIGKIVYRHVYGDEKL